MKVVKQLREIHQEAEEKFKRLATEVRETLKPKAEEYDWFFLCRIKTLESFALKVETGRVPDPLNMEDFFACTIIVPTFHQIEDAERLVKSLYDDHVRRPTCDGATSKASYSFVFDDLRLYVRRRSQKSGKYEDLTGLVFEVQIKTILQYAWSVATHDLIYKTDTVSWPRERIAYQVKAMLEHAEVAIAEADRLSGAGAVAKNDDRTNNILRIIEQVNAFWPEDRLPKDIKRLAEIVLDLLRCCDTGTHQLTPILEGEKRRIGILPSGLSPYAFFIQSLANTNAVDFQTKFKKNKKVRVIIHSDMDLPEWMLDEHDRIINLK
jgi:ppGpp synthetase/RelA/SpoT-type nucleotidyltranferase